jgi:lipid A disaccharide synthetase
MNPKRLEKELNVLLHDEKKIEIMKNDYHQLRLILGDGGASKKVAKTILN